MRCSKFVHKLAFIQFICSYCVKNESERETLLHWNHHPLWSWFYENSCAHKIFSAQPRRDFTWWQFTPPTPSSPLICETKAKERRHKIVLTGKDWRRHQDMKYESLEVSGAHHLVMGSWKCLKIKNQDNLSFAFNILLRSHWSYIPLNKLY